jgi:hypothetical protein
MALLTNESQFKTFLKKIGINSYRIAGNSIVLASPQSSRSGRKSELNSVQAFFKGSKFVDDGRSGYVETKINNKAIKIFSKPEKSASGIILKPSLFDGITDVDIPLSKYAEKVREGIESNKKLDGQQKQLLLALLKYHTTFSPSDLTMLKKTFASLSEVLPLNTINNDFGEVLGPLAVLKKKFLPITSASCSVFIPSRSNEPLLDYKIYDKTKKTEYKISAKSGDSTNTLKPGDVLMLIDESDKMRKKHQSTDQYKVLKLLKENSWKEGPILALDYLKSKRLKEAAWLKNTKYTEPTRQQAENSLVEISRNSLDFTSIYTDATNAKVYYVKFQIGKNGVPEWEILANEEDRPKVKKRIEFRSKNYVGRPNGDKLGFQPK